MGTITKEKQTELENLYQGFLHHELILKMKDIPMHRGSNCYIHSFKVCKLVIKKALKKKKPYHLESLIIASVFHDYYLYDWRSDHSKRKKHGKRHPYIAEANAKRDFHIDEEVSKIIKSHMWPLTLKEFPKTREAKLVNLVDDVIATREFLTSVKYKKKREERYLKYISQLFEQ